MLCRGFADERHRRRFPPGLAGESLRSGGVQRQKSNTAYANADRAAELLGWKAEMSIEQGIADALEWGKVRAEILGL